VRESTPVRIVTSLKDHVADVILRWSVAIGGDNGLDFMGSDEETALATFLLTVVVLWGIWAVVFYRFSKKAPPDQLLARTMRTLLKGSILEVLVAVPCHVIVRHRDDCCAPLGTFLGIATGLIVMLASFGPGVFFLFVERARRLRPPSKLLENQARKPFGLTREDS